MISIIDFEDKYAPAFKALNLVWLDKFGLTEPADLLMLNNPRHQIIDTGGYIYLAKAGAEIIGSGALIKENATHYELAKMVVAPAFQGQGISKLLIEKCISKARELAARRIFLLSNSQLTTAIALYEKYGFRHIPITNSHYATADVMMEILL